MTEMNQQVAAPQIGELVQKETTFRKLLKHL